jgi:hypothetical protein
MIGAYDDIEDIRKRWKDIINMQLRCTEQKERQNKMQKEVPELATFRGLALRVQNGSKTGSRRLRKMG